MSSQPRRGGRTGRGGRGGGGGGSLRGSAGPSRRGANNNNNNNRRPRPAPVEEEPAMRDEEVLIAFMPYLKGDHAAATKIHNDYQSSGDQKAFLTNARAFLDQQQRSSAAKPSSYSLLPPSLERPVDPASLFAPSVPSDHITGDELLTNRPDPPGMSGQERSPHRPPGGLHDMSAIENGLDALLQDDPIVPTPVPPAVSNIWGPAGRTSASTSPITPPRPAPAAAPSAVTTSPWNSSLPGLRPLPPPAASMPPQPLPQSLLLPPTASAPPTPSRPPPHMAKDSPRATPTNEHRPVRKEPPVVKRLWTHFEEQPGRLLVDGYNGSDPSLILSLAPRQELTAHWSLPLDYINQKRAGAKSLDQALDGLTVGLFRRGCTENGAQASIISKKVLGDGNRTYDCGVDPANNSVRGKVPFYSPRTPGNVLFRLYWDQEPIHTLAMGPTLHVRVMENDFDSSIRFILSNFKGKKSNPTSLSSLNSLAQVLETPLTCPNESAARAVWGCVQEARKVVDACAQEYHKTTSKLAQLEETVEELKKQVEEEEDAKSQELSATPDEAEDEAESEAASTLRDKTKTLMSGRASCERKWRDSQLAFSSILRAAVTNPSMPILLRRDMITKMRLEFELWCPLSEEFASPNEDAKMWYEPLRDMNHAITADDFQAYAQARSKMQARTLGFELNTSTLDDVLFPRNRGAPNQRTMDPGAVTVFNNMSAAMGQSFQELHSNEDAVVRRRELIRERTEQCVQECGVFPPGTRVVIFGSSANGFGSPNSDIDMCLQLPASASLGDDESGAGVMAQLAKQLEISGMQDVDTVRLTARIPVVNFFCPDPLAPDDDEEKVECDLSMHNPLAVLNTALLRTYAEITPVTRVLSSIIKQWAKARDINNPARHTLSSYGYIIMLLHFMTYHKRTGNGLVAPVAPPEGEPRYRMQPGQQGTPLLPNLQWMDPTWPGFPRGTPYRELPALPRQMIKHPIEEGKVVNSFFYKPNTPNDKGVLQMLFPGQDLSLAILLASFFRYYAYEFDYKRFVVSLHSTATRGLVEREVKAELDGWRNYSAALTIEDPFETFYDVAHVLRGGYYHRIRREFAVAYSKIADAASGRQGTWNKGDLRSLSGQELIDWICEPVANEREQNHHHHHHPQA